MHACFQFPWALHPPSHPSRRVLLHVCGSRLWGGEWILKPTHGRAGRGVIKISRDSAGFCAVDVASGRTEEQSLVQIVERCRHHYPESSWIRRGFVLTPFLPRIAEGELRLLLTGNRCVGVVARGTPVGALSAAPGSRWLPVEEDEETDRLRRVFLRTLPRLANAAGLDAEAEWPLVWTADFIRRDLPDRFDVEEVLPFALSEINSLAVGHTTFPSMKDFGFSLANYVKDRVEKTSIPIQT